MWALCGPCGTKPRPFHGRSPWPVLYRTVRACGTRGTCGFSDEFHTICGTKYMASYLVPPVILKNAAIYLVAFGIIYDTKSITKYSIMVPLFCIILSIVFGTNETNQWNRMQPMQLNATNATTCNHCNRGDQCNKWSYELAHYREPTSIYIHIYTAPGPNR